MSSFSKAPKKVGPYQVGQMIGKGAFGTVYRGFHIETGNIVAIKQVGRNIKQDHLKSIQSQINLLKKLQHENIVQYIDFIQCENCYNIILQYVQSGSLANIIQQFGPFNQSLVSIYIKQVLTGLQYLHYQGIVHRDIQGANILTTKDGVVKLTDFGVATRLTEKDNQNQSFSFAGTPYWMAPEIIEMSGSPSTSCDIWSLGCTVIELLTGNPPYHDLLHYPALFRMVEDEHPPLPQGITENCKNFLLRCFQQQPISRIDAKGLLKHPWIGTNNNQVFELINSPDNQFPEEVTNTIRLHIENFQTDPNLVNPSINDGGQFLKNNPNTNYDEINDAGVFNQENFGIGNNQIYISNQSLSSNSVSSDLTNSQENNYNNNNNNNNFAKDYIHNNYTNYPNNYQNTNLGNISSNQNVQSFRIQTGIAPYQDSQNQNNSNNNSMKNGLQINTQLNNNNNLQFSYQNSSKSSVVGGGVPSLLIPGLQNLRLIGGGAVGVNHNTGTMGSVATSNMDSFVENMYPHYDFSSADKRGTLLEQGSFVSMADHNDNNVNTLLQFDSVQQNKFKKKNNDPHHSKKEYQMYLEINQIFNQINSDVNDVFDLEKSLNYLTDIISGNLKLKYYIMQQYGLSSFLQILDSHELISEENQAIVEAILSLINQLVIDDQTLIESACVFGIIPYLLRYSKHETPYKIQAEAVLFLWKLVNHPQNLKILISAGGFEALIQFLDVENNKNVQFAVFSMEILLAFFKYKYLNHTILCRMLTQYEICTRLLLLIDSLFREQEVSSNLALNNALQLLMAFAQCDEPIVRKSFHSEEVLATLIMFLKKFPQKPHCFFKLIKVIRYSCSDLNIINRLENLNIIPELIICLEKVVRKAIAIPPELNFEEFLQDILKIINCMCNLNQERQESFAQSGAVPLLLEIGNSTQSQNLQKYSFLILSQFVQASQLTRKSLWQSGGPKFLINLLKDELFIIKTIDALSSWLELEPHLVDQIIQDTEVVSKLVQSFKKANANTIQQILPAYQQIIFLSESLAIQFSQNTLFLQEISQRLSASDSIQAAALGPTSTNIDLKNDSNLDISNMQKQKNPSSNNFNQNQRVSPICRKYILEILLQICLKSGNPRIILDSNKIYPTILSLMHTSHNNDLVIIEEISSQLITLYSSASISSAISNKSSLPFKKSNSSDTPSYSSNNISITTGNNLSTPYSNHSPISSLANTNFISGGTSPFITNPTVNYSTNSGNNGLNSQIGNVNLNGSSNPISSTYYPGSNLIHNNSSGFLVNNPNYSNPNTANVYGNPINQNNYIQNSSNSRQISATNFHSYLNAVSQGLNIQEFSINTTNTNVNSGSQNPTNNSQMYTNNLTNLSNINISGNNRVYQ